MRGSGSVLVVADDLTGANAAAVLYSRLGLRTSTLTLLSALEATAADVTVITTGTRRLPPLKAAERVRSALEAAEVTCPQVLVKRVDTTLRGPIGAELAEVLGYWRRRHAGRVAALAVPAYPAAGRTTVGGIQLLDGVPLARSRAANDGSTPLRSSRVADLLSSGTSLTTTELHVDVVDGSEEALAASLAVALTSADVTIVDAITDADVGRIAAAAVHARSGMGDIVIVDSGPFGAAYCAVLKPTLVAPRTPVLVIVGSPAETTRGQVEAANRSTTARIWPVDEHVSGQELVHLVITAIDEGATVTGWYVRPESVELDEDWALGVPSMLGAATRNVFAARPVAGAFACGGDVSAAVIGALGALGLEVESEVQPLVVAGRLIGGEWDHLPIVTKGGLVGNRDAIMASVDHLRGMSKVISNKGEPWRCEEND
jgi:uncharacterized protein YgbK (DUF1537 family)